MVVRRRFVFVLFCLALLGTPLFAEVLVQEDTITLPSYKWMDDRNPELSEYGGRIYYPYTRQDHLTGTKADRTYKTIVLENEYLRVTCIPELGGRIHSVFNKTTGDEMFHKNEEIKPALIAMRGAWISGGIEWNVGPQGHTVTIVSPVDATYVKNDDGSVTLVVGNTEKMFRTRWTVRLTLHPGKAYLDEEIRMYNPTDGTHPYYFWNCTAFPNLEGTRFIYPMTLGCDHNGTKFFTWPMHNGKDITYLKNYPTMSSVFAYECEFDFFGAYDVDRKRGIVSYANHLEVKGKKAWTWGKDDYGVTSQMALSDAGPVYAPYIEVQSGPLLTQADYGMLRPHQAVEWQEFWYPVHDFVEGYEFATRDAAVEAIRDGNNLALRILATGVYPGAQVILSRDGEILREENIDLSPSAPVLVTLENAQDAPVAVRLLDAEGAVLLAYTTPLAIPLVEEPDLTKQLAREDGEATADELFAQAFLTDSQTKPDAARAGYEKVLDLDPLHEEAHTALATLDIEWGRYETAAQHAQSAVERNPGNGAAWHLLGTAQWRLGQHAQAREAGYSAARTTGHRALGYDLVGRAEMSLGNAEAAEKAFAKAVAEAPRDARFRDRWHAARYALGERDSLAKDLRLVVEQEDPTNFTARALFSLASENGWNGFTDAVENLVGEKEFLLLDIAAFLNELGLYRETVELLGVSVQDPSPWSRYCYAYYWHAAENAVRTRMAFEKVDTANYQRVFPAGVWARPVLAYATEERPKDGLAWLFLGHLQASLHNPEEAAVAWRKAVELNPNFSEGWRMLAKHALQKDKDKVEAERCYKMALQAAPEDQILYVEFAGLLESLGRRLEGIVLVEEMPEVFNTRFDVILWLATAYNKEGRHADCLALLKPAAFSNWEGSSKPRDIFVEAALALGKANFEARQYDQALLQFEEALTYPENLSVGQRYEVTDAEVRYWQGKTLLALERAEEARAAWKTGAGQIAQASPDVPMISVSNTQTEYVQRCKTALEILIVQ